MQQKNRLKIYEGIVATAQEKIEPGDVCIITKNGKVRKLEQKKGAQNARP